MPAAALILALSSALMHATWNYLVKTARDRLVTAWALVIAGAAAFSPVLVAAGGVDRSAWGHIVVSGVIHTVYALTLTRAYERGDLSTAYPVARGLAPMLVALGALVFLSEQLGAIAVVGLMVVSVALLVVAYEPGALRSSGWAVATGFVIAAYTVVDASGVRAADHALAYTTAVFIANAVMLTPLVVVVRSPGEIGTAVAAERWRTVLAGLLSLGAYALVLGAALVAPIGLVAAVRETSIVFGALAGAVLLREGMGVRRVSGSAAIVVGVVLLGLS